MPASCHRGEQHGGAEVVVADVVGRVGGVHTVPDHRGLVADDVDTAQRARNASGSRTSPCTNSPTQGGTAAPWACGIRASRTTGSCPSA